MSSLKGFRVPDGVRVLKYFRDYDAATWSHTHYSNLYGKSDPELQRYKESLAVLSVPCDTIPTCVRELARNLSDQARQAPLPTENESIEEATKSTAIAITQITTAAARRVARKSRLHSLPPLRQSDAPPFTSTITAATAVPSSSIFKSTPSWSTASTTLTEPTVSLPTAPLISTESSSTTASSLTTPYSTVTTPLRPCFTSRNSVSSLETFEKSIRNFEGDPWITSKGVNVDLVLLESARKQASDDILHSCILDKTCPRIRQLFDDETWAEVNRETRIRYAELDDDVVHYLMSFNITSVSKLLERLRNSDAGNHPEKKWIYKVFFNMADLYNDPYMELHQPHSERFFELHIWKHLIDDLFFGDPDVILCRGEPQSRASSDRKNGSAQRTLDERRKVGRKVDGLFISRVSDDDEIGGIEVAKTDIGTFDTKFLLDQKKLAKLSKDQLDRTYLYDLPIIGLQQSATKLRVTTLMRRVGRLFYVFDASPPVSVPKTLEDVEDLLVLMSHLLVFKRSMKHNLSTWKRFKKTKTKQELFSLLHDPNRTPPTSPICPSTASTPPKKAKLDAASIE
ncbi:hypothetical protein BGZ51_005516 [Haplosporangium sp. Z 767]|nr:hypothetical protein BGZ50_005891 [Haplosporangium sp. Z 11]KAF9181349.1 hypothetical protein BGZ51_005516 [Haplosporangium sp. Z 767]